MKSKESDNAKSNPGSGMLIPGEPDAGKACTSGSEGGVEKRTVKATRSAPTLPQATRGAPAFAPLVVEAGSAAKLSGL